MAGAGLRLEPLVAAHADELFPLLCDDELWIFTEEKAPETLEALAARYAQLESRRSPDGAQQWLNWAVISERDGVAGFVQATVPAGSSEAEVAYVIARRFWLRGLGTEAMRTLLAFLRDGLKLERAVATVDARNSASLALLRRLGFEIVDDRDPHNVQLGLVLETASL